MSHKRYKFRREDFGELPVILDHLNIYLNFLDNRVEAVNCLSMTAREPLEELRLDAADLEILRVDWCRRKDGCRHSDTTLPCFANALCGPTASESKDSLLREGTAFIPLEFDYQRDQNKLIVKLPHSVEAGDRCCIRTVTHCFPSEHILEGIYKDATPAGAPQQYMSQCQQWGFQRIMPILDDCRAKCTMATTLEADAAYSHLITNGDIDRRLNPDLKPIAKPDDRSRQIIGYEHRTPMAPYLFLACVGTWDALTDSVEYDSGKAVRLEYLVPPGRTAAVRIPMEILKRSVLWIATTQDYEYSGDAYRTITMNKSNFGGMENVGNTTIVTDAALIDEHTLDASLLYAHAVIVHEFEHNQCGSETTMETPFDVWLNEAYTVDVERQFLANLFNPAFIRLYQVDSIRNPLLGPLAVEDAGHVGRIVREGFNDPDELIDGVTYVKAAEVIRMLRLVLGADRFKAGKTLYFSRYKNGNANTDQFFQCFEEVSGVSLEQFKREWLYRIGYPRLTATSVYDAEQKVCRITFRQELKDGAKPFHIPIQLALVDRRGCDLPGTEQVFQLREEQGELNLGPLTEPPAFASINRDFSFYGTLRLQGVTPKLLARQVRLDPNACNRVDAMRQLTDRERVRLLYDLDVEVDELWVALYGEILADVNIPPALKAYFLRIDEQPMDREYSTWHRELVAAREKLMLTINRTYREKLLDHFLGTDTYSPEGGGWTEQGIEKRLLKNVLLDLLAADDSEASHALIMDHYHRAANVTDRVAALTALNRSSAANRLELLEQAYTLWHPQLSAYANYLRVVSSGTQSDVFAMIEREKRRSSFDIKQPTWCRALFLPMASNSKMLWSETGVHWLADTVIELSAINTTTASRLLNAFQHVRRLKPDLRDLVLPALQRIAEAVSGKANPTIHGQVSAYLSN